MRNVGSYYHPIEIQEVSHTQDRNGALVPSYETKLRVWAHKRIFRTGQGGTKNRQDFVETNMERLQFRFTPSAATPVKWNYVVLYQGERYEIAYIQDFKDETVLSCYTTPISNTRRP